MALDPLQRRRDREAEEAKRQAQPPRLNPPFPFRPLPFDAAFFGVDEPPPEPAEGAG